MQKLAKEYKYLSRPVEELIRGHQCESAEPACSPSPDKIAGDDKSQSSQSEPYVTTCDVLIVGSGYGGAMAANVLAGTPRGNTNQPIRVVMFERGKEFAPGEFPESLGDLPGEVRFHRESDNDFIGDASALFDFRSNRDVSVLVANGLGGGSLINANVALKPDSAIFKNGKWPRELQTEGVLNAHFVAAEELLGVESPPVTWMPKKYSALARLANSIGATTQPAPLTVDIDQCTKCGNCITGCNVGAKKTLPFTILRDAQQNGAEIYTGASVLTLRRTRDKSAWLVRFRRTVTAKTILNSEVFQIRAKIVILAAGTLGSTEILLRSRDREKLSCSNKVGNGFSTNGDMISFGYAGSLPVDAIGKSSDETHDDPGPTITGYSRLSFHNNGTVRPLVMQDAAVPLALNQIFGEIVTTGSLLARYVKGDPPAWFKDNQKNPDPLTVQPGAITNSQIVLAMGYDNAGGTMELVPPKAETDALDQARIVVKWSNAGKDPVFKFLDDTFKKAHDNDGFDGGDYIPNPAWKAVPEGFEQAFTGGAPAGKLLTVHPLGGCAMSDSAENGVVNHLGQVFNSSASDNTYSDLYVMDGAIIPGALGVNPFLTISAIAHRNSLKIRKQIEAGTFPFDQVASRNDSGSSRTVSYGVIKDDPYSTKSLDKKPITIVVRERLARGPGPLPALTDQQYVVLIDRANEYVKMQSTKSENSKPFDKNRHYRLVLNIEAVFDLNTYLADPDGTPLKGMVQLLLDPSQSLAVSESVKGISKQEDGFASHSLFVEPIIADQLVPIAEGTCDVNLLVRDDPDGLIERTFRWAEVAYAALKHRGPDISDNVLKSFNELNLTVIQHTHWRKFKYTLTFKKGSLTQALGSFTLSGQKLLAYTGENPWKALFKMGITLNAKSVTENLGDFHVDLNYLLKDGIPQVKESPHMPATLVGMTRLGLFALRTLFQTHLWSFGAPNYKEHKPLGPVLPEAITLASGRRATFCAHSLLDHGELNDLPDNSRNKKTEIKPYIRLARYALEETEKRSQKKHLLLIHGLAHGGAVFTTSTIKTPMATYFVEQGYVVWVLDHRLSPALEWEPHRRPVTMDNLAKIDIPIAVDHVYKEAGCEQIDVFAHCIGAGAFAMAALKGWLHDNSRNQSKIKCATIHAVTPWLVPSPKNAASAKLAAFYKDSLRFDDPSKVGFDPIPPATSDPDFLEVLIDRIAGSIPWPSGHSERHQRAHTDKHMSKAVCDRMTLWYGYEWNHFNLSDETHEQIGSLVGFGNLEVFRHIYFCILRNRLTDREGRNIYLTDNNIQNHWAFDTMFIHGSDNQVFSPAGSSISAWKLNKTMEEIAKDDTTYRKPNVWRCDVYGYGHMDLLFGREAFQHIYPSINDFFQNVLESTTSAEAKSSPTPVGAKTIYKEHSGGEIKYLPSGKPETGLIFFKPEPISDSKVNKLHVWLEPTSNSTSRPVGISLADFDRSDYTFDHISDDHLSIPSEYGNYWVETINSRSKTRRQANKKQGELNPEKQDSDQVGPSKSNDELINLIIRHRGKSVPENFPVVDSNNAETSISSNGTSFMPQVRYERHDVPMKGTIDNIKLEEVISSGDNKTWSDVSDARPGWLNKLDRNAKHLAFVLGSCRYPGSPFEKEASDHVYTEILSHANSELVENSLDFSIFLGDQIYADATANVFDTTEVVERYWERYRGALGSKNMRELLNYLPTYFAVDDHEFDDNWLGDETLDPNVDPKKTKQYRYARDAARSYQGMAGYTGNQKEYKFWYQFETLGYPFFVMDTRTRRKIRRSDTKPEAVRIVNPEQWCELTMWLDKLKHYNGPKFIACGVPLAPPLEETIRHHEAWRNDDSWLGFPGSLALLVEYIVTNDIQNVVLIGGDLHLSAYATMTFKAKNKSAKVHQIVASGLYAPLPFGNTKPRDLGHGLYKIPGSEIEIDFDKPQILTTSPSHFVRVDVKPVDSRYQILIQAFGDKALGDAVSLTTS